MSDLDIDLDAFISPSAENPAGQQHVRMQNTLASLFKAAAEDCLQPGHGAIKRALNKNKAQQKKETKEKATSASAAKKAVKAATKAANKKKKATRAAKPTTTSTTKYDEKKARCKEYKRAMKESLEDGIDVETAKANARLAYKMLVFNWRN